ncbi:MAG: ABATE domain-containing protein [Gemmatimonadaceae bacterium]|nr:ABATE domain-containing protein [Gemmatimonadaceae bacterium]
MQPVELPLLGEPAAVELANTRYGSGVDAFDFLADPRHAAAWLRHVVGATRIDDLAALRALRDAAHRAIDARVRGHALRPADIATINRHAADAQAAAELLMAADGTLSSTIRFRGASAVRARLAMSCIEVLTGPHPLRRCEGDGCGLFFVQQHGRRRFCADDCSHRVRQQRYRRRLS